MSLSKAIVPYHSHPSAKRPRIHSPSPDLETTPTPRRREPLPAATPFQEDGDAEMEEPESPSKRGRGTNFRVFGSPPEDFLSQADILQWGELLNTLIPFGGVVDPLDVVVSCAVMAAEEDGLELDQQVFRTFKGATSPDKADFKGGAQAKFWWRAHKKRGGTLAGGKELVHRSVKGRSLVWFLPLVVAWPPPVFCGPEEGSSFLWQFELDKARGEDSQLKALLKKLSSEGYSGYSFKAVRPILPFVCL